MPIGERARRVVTFTASGGRFGTYRSHTKFITLVGEFVHDALPTKANLRKRQIVQDDICDSCRMESESIGISYGVVRKHKRHWATLKWREGQTLRDVARSKICCGHC